MPLLLLKISRTLVPINDYTIKYPRWRPRIFVLCVFREVILRAVIKNRNVGSSMPSTYSPDLV